MYKIPANTLFVGKNIIYVPVCHSTNTLASEIADKAPLADGTLVITDNQFAGRGQRGNGWEAEPGKNLTFSVILKPTFLAIKNQFLLTQIVSLALHDFIQPIISAKASIKWPNDIYIETKKVCGILIENTLSNEAIQQSIVGIGLNVNQDSFQVERATSLSIATEKKFFLQEVLNSLLERIEARYLQLKRHDYASIQSDYLERLFRLNESHQFISQNNEFVAEIKGVDQVGRLVLKTETGERVFDVKQISFKM